MWMRLWRQVWRLQSTRYEAKRYEAKRHEAKHSDRNRIGL